MSAKPLKITYVKILLAKKTWIQIALLSVFEILQSAGTSYLCNHIRSSD